MKKGKDGFYCRYIKRILDVFFSLIALVVLSVPMIVVALLVRIRIGSPVLFRQIRIGKDNKKFKLMKFRSMTEARDENGIYLPDDERLVPLGRIIRNSSIDELPSLLNILHGEMSIIGPRPLPVRYLPRYTAEQLRRHEVKPGLSAPSVVRGRNTQSWEEQFSQDVWYVDNVGFLVDAKSVLDTIRIVLTREGATSGDGGARTEFIGIAEINNFQDSEGNYVKL